MPSKGDSDSPGGSDWVTEYARPVRGWSYIILAFLSAMEIAFTIARLVYTLTPRGADRFLNNGNPFYEGVVMEMAVVSFLTLAFCVVMIYLIKSEREMGVLSRNWFETACLAVFWFLWIGGAGGSTSIWPDLNFCVQFSQCRILQAMMAWAWLGWIDITILLLPSLWFGFSRGAWSGQVYNGWKLYDEEKQFVPHNKRRTKTTTMDVSAPIIRPENDNPFEPAHHQRMVDQWLLTDPKPSELPGTSRVAEASVRQNLRAYN